MDDLSDRLRELGAAVAEVSDRVSDRPSAEGVGEREGALERARRAFVSPPVRPPPARRGRRSPWIPVLAAAACVALAGAGWRLRAPVAPGVTPGPPASPPSLPPSPLAVGGPLPLSFSVGAAGAPGVVGEWMAAGADAPLQARFSDGSAVQLAPGASMRVTAAGPAGADVLIERGSVHAAVMHPAGAPAHWAVRAGTFEVRVTGTTFDAAWDPLAETFELTMLEGRVVVTGPSLPPDRAVVAGERLLVSVRDARMTLSTAGSDGGSRPQIPRPDGSSRPQTPGLDAGYRPQIPGPAAWRELAAKGRYRDAFAAAEAAGIGQEMERAPAGDLLLLADAARFAGSAGRAREALLAARRRFGVRGQSAFLLGKIAADQQGSPGEAVSWFETYLGEEPGGALAEEALGRILDLARRGDPETAKRAAARYLARYPEGTHAALARSLSP